MTRECFFSLQTQKAFRCYGPPLPGKRKRGGGGGYAWTPLLGGIVFILFQLGGA